MGTIKQEVYSLHINKFPEEESLLKPFLQGFDIDWALRRKAYNTELSFYLLKPEKHLMDTFGFDHEILTAISKYDTIEARTIQAIESLFTSEPIKGRADQSIYFLITPSIDAREWLTAYTIRNPQSRIPVVFSSSDIEKSKTHSWGIRNYISEQLFTRDLFDYQLPLSDDLFFFGRDQAIADNMDAIKRSQNRGIFGLRKTGKTSLLYKLKRSLERSNTGKVFYYDCKIPSIRLMRWFEFLNKIIHDVTSEYSIKMRVHKNERQISDSLFEMLSKTPETMKTILIFDEIEYVSPMSKLDLHWHQDFIPFWQTLWAAQSQIQRLSNVIAGVNPSIIERDSIHGTQNPLFGIIQSKYLRGFDISELRNMVKFFGKRMGMRFSEDAIQYLYKRYGGHPLLTRQACSLIHAELSNSNIERPFNIDIDILKEKEVYRDNELTYYCRHVVSELKEFYPDEYEMLELLAGGAVSDFMDLQDEPEYSRHIKEYGLISTSEVGKPSFAIPVIGHYIGSEMAHKAKTRIRKMIVPEAERQPWIKRRVEAIIREIRELEHAAMAHNSTELYGSSSFPEAEKFSQIKICKSQDDFIVFINTCNRCFVESLEQIGNKKGSRDYFWTTIKSTYPDLWNSLLRIKVYRHNDLHLQLNNSTEKELKRFLSEDLEGKKFDQISEPWFLLQQCVVEELFVAIQLEINRVS